MSDTATATPAPVTETTPAAVKTETPTTPPVVTPTPPEQPKADPMAAKFAALARKDKEAKAREQALTAKEQSIAERIARAEKIEKALASKDDDPLEVFNALGIEVDKFADSLIAGPKKPKDPQTQALEKMQARLEAIEAERAKEREEYQNKGRNEAVEKFQSKIAESVKAAGEKYELIQERGAVPLVYAVIEKHYEQTKELLSNEEAADMVEAHLEKEAKEQAQTLFQSKSKKIQAALKAAGLTPAQAAAAVAAVAGTTERAPGTFEMPQEDVDDKPLTTEDWLAAAEESGGKSSMVLTNETQASLPKYQYVKEDTDELEQAIALLKFR